MSSKDAVPSLFPRDVVRGRVVAGEMESHYYRAGNGTPVLVLSNDIELLSSLFEHLPRRFCLLAPTLSVQARNRQASPDAAAWLGNFLDTLGVSRVAIITDAPELIAVLRIADVHRDRVTRVVVLLHSVDRSEHLPAATHGDGSCDALPIAWVAHIAERREQVVSQLLQLLDGADVGPYPTEGLDTRP